MRVRVDKKGACGAPTYSKETFKTKTGVLKNMAEELPRNYPMASVPDLPGTLP